MLEAAAAIFTILGTFIATFAFVHQLRSSGNSTVRKETRVSFRGHSSFKKWRDSILSKHGVVVIFLLLFYLIGFVMPQIIPPVGFFIIALAIMRATPSRFFYNITTSLLVTAFGFIGAYASGILDIEWVYKDGLEFLDIYYVLQQG